MEKRDRFLLEDYIMNCWNVTNDLATVAKYIGESSDIPNDRRIILSNMLVGMKELYDRKFEHLYNLFAELKGFGNHV